MWETWKPGVLQGTCLYIVFSRSLLIPVPADRLAVCLGKAWCQLQPEQVYRCPNCIFFSPLSPAMSPPFLAILDFPRWASLYLHTSGGAFTGAEHG